MLNWTERIIRMRKEVPEVGWGDFTDDIDARSGGVDIRYDWRNNSVFFVHNLDENPREIAFASGFPATTESFWSISCPKTTAMPTKRGRHTLMLEGYGYRWYRVGGLDYLLKRSDIDTNAKPGI